MDNNNALKIRGIIRIIACIFAAGATVTAFIYRVLMRSRADQITGLCMIARICAIAMFVAMLGAVIIALVSKSFSPKIDGAAFVIALIGFIGNFVIAPGSTLMGLGIYVLSHIKDLYQGTFDGTQLDIGAYMIMLSGILLISYTVKNIKSGN